MSIKFFVLGLFLIGVCLGCLAWPLGRWTAGPDRRRQDANIEVYRQRYGEIRDAAGAGQLSMREAEAERDRIGQQLLVELDTAPQVESAVRGYGDLRRRWRPWVAAGLLVAAIATGGYAWTGDWRALRHSDTPRIEPQLQQLQDRVRVHPDDRHLRLMLARAQKQHGQYAAAARSLQRINEHSVSAIPRLLVGEAEMRLAAGADLGGKVQRLFARALAAEPGNTKALWYLGLAASGHGDTRKALGYWDRLLQQPLSDSVRAKVRNRREMLTDDTPASADPPLSARPGQ